MIVPNVEQQNNLAVPMAMSSESFANKVKLDAFIPTVFKEMN